MKFNLFYLGVIAVLVAVIFLQRSCNKCPSISTTSVTKTDTVYLTVRDTTVVFHPMPSEVLQNGVSIPITIHDTIFSVIKEPIDTAAILADYYLTRIYIDTAQFRYGHLITKDSVTQNKLLGRNVVAYFDKIPQITNTVTLNPVLKNKLYIGFDIGSNGTSTLGAGPLLLFQTKKDQLYHAGVDIMTGGAYYHVGTLWKIHF